MSGSSHSYQLVFMCLFHHIIPLPKGLATEEYSSSSGCSWSLVVIHLPILLLPQEALQAPNLVPTCFSYLVKFYWWFKLHVMNVVCWGKPSFSISSQQCDHIVFKLLMKPLSHITTCAGTFTRFFRCMAFGCCVILSHSAFWRWLKYQQGVLSSKLHA